MNEEMKGEFLYSTPTEKPFCHNDFWQQKYSSNKCVNVAFWVPTDHDSIILRMRTVIHDEIHVLLFKSQLYEYCAEPRKIYLPATRHLLLVPCVCPQQYKIINSLSAEAL